MKRILFSALATLVVIVSAAAQNDAATATATDSASVSASASVDGRKSPNDWHLLAGADFDVLFDNREYAGCEFGESQTLFSSRLTPVVGVGWGGDKNRLMFGMDLRSDFGNKTDVFADIRPQVYYRFDNRRAAAYAGIFPRERMLGDYGELFVSDSMSFYENLVQGVMGQYRGDRGYVELSIDWCGMYSEASREKFRIMSAGRLWFDRPKRFYGGYNFSMLHYAGSEQIAGCVVDHIMIDPYIGAAFKAWFDFDISLHYVQSLQHDRSNERSFRKPKGGMLRFRMSKWGIFIDEQLYMGEDLMPFYSSYRSERFPDGYGGDFYACETFFGTTKHIYNHLKLGYDRRFFDDTLGVKCYIAMQYDGTAWGTKQMVQVSVRLLKDIPLYRKKN